MVCLNTGVTSDLVKRVWQHKNKIYDGFTARYNLNMLVYYEVFADTEHAILREKQIKGYRRQKKLDMINKMNPKWVDLYEDICRSRPLSFRRMCHSERM